MKYCSELARHYYVGAPSSRMAAYISGFHRQSADLHAMTLLQPPFIFIHYLQNDIAASRRGPSFATR